MRRIDHPYIFINKTLRRFSEVPGPDGEPWRALFKEPARVSQPVGARDLCAPGMHLISCLATSECGMLLCGATFGLIRLRDACALCAYAAAVQLHYRQIIVQDVFVWGTLGLIRPRKRVRCAQTHLAENSIIWQILLQVGYCVGMIWP